MKHFPTVNKLAGYTQGLLDRFLHPACAHSHAHTHRAIPVAFVFFLPPQNASAMKDHRVL